MSDVILRLAQCAKGSLMRAVRNIEFLNLNIVFEFIPKIIILKDYNEVVRGLLKSIQWPYQTKKKKEKRRNT